MLGVSEWDKGKQCVPAAYSWSDFLRGREWLADAQKKFDIFTHQNMQQKQRAAGKTEENKASFAVAICFAETQSLTILQGLFEAKHKHTHNKNGWDHL